MTKIRIESVPDLIRKTGDIRKAVVRAARNIPGMHFGGPMSAVDPAVMIYYKYLGFDPDNLDDPERNMVILSKGHNGILFYTIYVDMGMYTDEELYGKYNTIDGVFGPHPNRKTIKGIEVSTGSLGHGLNWAVGISHARQDMGIKARTFVVLVSMCQINFFSETGTVILACKSPIKFWELIVCFLERTLIAMVLAAVAVRIFF